MATPPAAPVPSDVVVVPASALAVVTGELSKRVHQLDAETRSALATLTGALAAIPPTPSSPTAALRAPGSAPAEVDAASAHHESTCDWTKDVANGTFRCAHGVMMSTHPRGWCDQACCR
jgi:hypothetical protein